VTALAAEDDSALAEQQRALGRLPLRALPQTTQLGTPAGSGVSTVGEGSAGRTWATTRVRNARRHRGIKDAEHGAHTRDWNGDQTAHRKDDGGTALRRSKCVPIRQGPPIAAVARGSSMSPNEPKRHIAS
jgi:hypothetical protein